MKFKFTLASCDASIARATGFTEYDLMNGASFRGTYLKNVPGSYLLYRGLSGSVLVAGDRSVDENSYLTFHRHMLFMLISEK